MSISLNVILIMFIYVWTAHFYTHAFHFDNLDSLTTLLSEIDFSRVDIVVF